MDYSARTQYRVVALHSKIAGDYRRKDRRGVNIKIKADWHD
jgi:hypothetical protein